MKISPLSPITSLQTTSRHLIHLPSIQQNIELATLEKAQEYRNNTSLRIFNPELNSYKNYPLCSTSESIFGRFGIGIELYFFFVRYLAILFFIISLISIYPMYSNYSGHENGSVNQNERYIYLTLANQAGISIYETDLDKAESELPGIKSNLNKLVAVDFVISFLFIIFICFYITRSRIKVLKDVGEYFKVSDFAVQVEGFPPFITKEQVIEQFSEYGEIEEVYLARNYEGKLPTYKKIYEMAYDIEVEKLIGLHRNIEKCISLSQEIRDDKINLNKTHDELFVDKVFVVFNSLKSKKKLLKDYKSIKNQYFCCRRKNNKETRRLAAFRLSVQSAPNPSDIIWENMEFSYFNVMRRRIIMFLITILIIIVSFILIYTLKGYFKSSVSKQDCKEKNISGNISINEAKLLYTSESDITCYCKQQSVQNLMSNENCKEFCQDYINSLAQSTFLRLCTSMFIVFISYLLKLIIKYLSKFERYKAKSEKRKTLLVKMFLLSFINTGLTTLLINSKIYEHNEGLNGKYDEINREWYNDVGSTITITMIINIFSQHAFQVLLIYPYGVLKRRFCYRRFKSQLKLNKFFRGPSFDISDSLSQILVVVCTNYFYSSGMPFLNLLCFLTLFLTYFCNKFLILRYYRKPPEYTQEINESLYLYLPIPIILHLVFSIYSFGSSEIFPDSVSKPSDSDYIKFNSNNFKDLIQKGSSICSLFMIASMIFLIFYLKFKRIDFYERFWNYKVYSEKNLNNTEFRDLKNKQKLLGLDTYDIRKNPKYKDLIKALDSVAKKRIDLGLDCEEIDDSSESDKERCKESMQFNCISEENENFSLKNNSLNIANEKSFQSFKRVSTIKEPSISNFITYTV